jgi:hypothetical protein
MSAKFVEGVGGKLAEQWVASLLTPAFIFWSGGLGFYILKHGWQPIANLFPDSKLEPLQLGVLAGALILIAISALVMQRFDTEILRGLEGYWYPGLRKLKILKWLRERQIKAYYKCWDEWEPLHEKLKQNNLTQENGLTQEQSAQYVRLDRTLRQFPRQDHDFLPTRLGNILRAAERRPYDRYGLDAIICWPRLWLLLPEPAKKELQEARATLNNGVRVFAWSILFLVWTIWAWWAIPCGLLSALFAYCWILDSATVYGDLIESVFDLYRISLYQSLRFPVPANTADERAIGLQVTEYLLRGSLPQSITFIPPSSEKK